MHAALQTLGAIIVVPYVALAMLFVFVGQVARTRGLKALIEVLWNQVDLFAGWVFYIAPLLWVVLVLTGFVPRMQKASALCLCLLALGSFVVITTMSSTRIGFGELLFLVPCLIVAVMGGWLCFRGVSP